MKTLRTIVVDDEPVSRHGLINMLNNYPLIENCGTAYSAETFTKAMQEHKPDLVFLDIMLRDRNSLDIIAGIDDNVQYIITTAYGQHALRGYELRVIDYLMKPISHERLSVAIERAWLVCNSLSTVNDSLFLRSEGKYHRFCTDEILFIQGMENYVVIQTESKRHVCKMTMTYIRQLLPHQFMQVHKSYIINTGKVEALDKLSVYIKTFVLPISRDKKQDVYKVLLGQGL